LGFNPYPTPVAITNGSYRGRNGCSYCGFCSSHACGIGAKGDLGVTAIADALGTGRLDLRPDSYVFRVEMKNGRADSVLYIDADGREQSVSGDTIVLSCSAVDTPRARAQLRAPARPDQPRPGGPLPDVPPLSGRDRLLLRAHRLLPRLLEHALHGRPLPGRPR